MKILLIIVGMATAIIDEQHLKLGPDDFYTNYLRFSFMDGGEIETRFDIKTSVNTDLGFYLCNPSQLDDLEDAFDDSAFCRKYDSAHFKGCDYNARVPAKVDELSYLANKTNITFDMYMETLGLQPEFLGEKELTSYEEQYINYTSNITSMGSDCIDVSVNSTTTYYFVLTNCAEHTIKVAVDYIVMNPNGEHLSVGYLELKDVMLAAKIAWGLILLTWIFTWFLTKFRHPKIVQVTLLIDSAMWTAYAFVEHEFWLEYSKQGVPNHLMESISFGLLSLAEALFFSSMVLIASGVGSVHKCHFRMIISAVICFCLVITARTILYFKGEIVLYAFAGLYMGFLIFLLRQICLTCRKLHEQLLIISSINLDPVGTDVWLRLRMYRILRVALSILMPLLCASYIFTIKFLVFLPWIAAAGHISIVILTYFILFLFIRFKRTNSYLGKVVFRLDDDLPAFTLKDIKHRSLPVEMFNPFASYPPDKVVRIVPDPIIVKLAGARPKVFFGFDLYSHEKTFDPDVELPERAKLYECLDESSDL